METTFKVVKRSDGDSDRVVNASQQVVTVTHWTRHDALQEGEGYQHRTKLDFSQCTEEEILSLAADAAIIAARPRLGFKTLPVEQIPTEIDVHEMLQSIKPRKAAVDKTRAKLAKQLGMDDAALKALLESVQR